jgi:leucyl-tRNA synthetase
MFRIYPGRNVNECTVDLTEASLKPIVNEEDREARQRGADFAALVVGTEDFPAADASLLASDTIEIPVQINGKVRTRLVVTVGMSQEELQAAAMADTKVQELLAGATPKKEIIVPGRLVNFGL